MRVYFPFLIVASLVTPYAAAQTPLPFADNFNDGVVAPGWVTPAGTWSESGGVFHGTNTAANTPIEIYWNGGFSWSDYSAEVDIAPLSGNTPATAELNIRYKSPTDTCACSLYQYNGTFLLLQVAGAPSQTFPFSYSLGHFYRLRATAVGHTITCEIVGHPETKLTGTSSGSLSGTVALRNTHIPVDFDNLLVASLSAAPTITAFKATPASITAGGSSTLSWSTANATSVSIDRGIGSKPVNGSIAVSPTATTTYTLTASGTGGTATKQATVTVMSAPACSLTCSPSVIPTATPGSLVQFWGSATPSNCSGSIAYSWTFGDGGTANEQNPTHTYTAPGTYTWTQNASDNGTTCSKSGTITITTAGASDFVLSDFTLNNGAPVNSGTPVDVDIPVRGALNGWAGGTVKARLYFIDKKDVGHDSWTLFGWGDNDERVRGYFEADQWLKPLAFNELAPLTIRNVTAFAPDYIDAVMVEVVNPDGTQINGNPHQADEKEIPISFDTLGVVSACVGTLITAVAPPLGGGGCVAKNWITAVGDIYGDVTDGYDFVVTTNLEAAGKYLEAGEHILNFFVNKAIEGLSTDLKCAPVASLITAAINEISPLWGGTGGCGTLLAHASLALFTQGALGTNNYLTGSTVFDERRQALASTTETLTAFYIEGAATLSVTDTTGHQTTFATNGTCMPGITNSSCASTNDFRLIIAPTAQGPFTSNATAATTGSFTIGLLAPSTITSASKNNGTLTLALTTGTVTTDSYTWTTTATTGDTFHIPTTSASTPQLLLTHAGATTTLTPQKAVIDPTPLPPQWFVAGMAYVQGALPGTLWQTDVTFFNPATTRSATYSLAFLDGQHPVDPAALLWTKLILGPEESLSTPNILAFFGQPIGSFGGLLVRGDVAPLPPVITARTFNNGDPTKGTFGLSVPPTQPSSGLTPQAALAQQFLIGLRDDNTAYTNIGLMNLTTNWSHAQLTFLDRSGATNLGQLTMDVPPYGVAQLTRPLAAAPPNGAGYPNPLDEFSVKVTVLSGGAVFPYATVIDRRSTDPIVVTASDRPSATYRMPGIVRLQGANNTVWRSRFYLTNPSTTSRKASISYSFIPCDATGCKSRVAGVQSDVTLLPGETLWADDFPKMWLSSFGFSVSDTTAYQSSYVDVSPAAGDPNQEPLLVLGQTYNDQPTGPVGLQVPGFTNADVASKTGANRRLLLAGLISNTSYRTNVALFLQSGSSGQCTVRVLSEAGVELTHQDVGLSGSNTFVQLNDAGLFASLPGNKDRLTIVIDSFDGDPIAAYATIVDNISGDATFVKAQPAP